MKRYLVESVLLVSMVMLGGCAVGNRVDSPTTLIQIQDIATGALATRPAIAEIDGKPALLYAAKDGRVTFQLGERRQQIDGSARVQSGNRFQLWIHDQNIHATWWSHESGKNLYFTTTADRGVSFSPVAAVNDEHGVLPPYSLTRGPAGVVGITYSDERLPNYQVFFNRSLDYGRTWATPDQRLDTPPPGGRSSAIQEPQSVEAGSVWFTAWTDSVYTDGQARYRIVSRRSIDNGATWNPPHVLYSADHHISSLMVKSMGDKIVVAADELNRGIFTLLSTDQGENWRDAGILSGTESASNSGIDLTLADGRGHLVWMQDRKNEKTKIMRGSVQIEQAKWVTIAQRMDPKSHDNTRSLSPVVMATKQGSLLAAWVDYRDIRPNIYLSASYDGGQVWTFPKAINKPGAVAAGWPQLIAWGDEVALAWESYTEVDQKKGSLTVNLIHTGNATAGISGLPNYPPLDESVRRSRLEQRVKALWNNRVKGDFSNEYDMYDFYYKSTMTKKVYLDGVGTIKYNSYDIKDMHIEGNEATVKMTINYEVPPVVLPMTGQKVSTPATDVDASIKWVWVEDDWFQVYVAPLAQQTLQY
jgi:hypothetical protein